MATTPPPYEPPAAPPPPPPEGASPGAPIPWEQPGYPVLEGLYETAKLLVLQPGEAFARVGITGSLGRPLLYAIIFGWVGIIASSIYRLALQGTMRSFMPQLPGGHQFALSTGWTIASMIFAPFFVLLGVFIWSGIVHLVLMLAGGAGSDFAATVRVVSYTQTTQLAQVLPVCGGLVAFVWSVVLSIVGLAQVHRTTTGKAAIAVLAPIVLCCVCVVAGTLMFGAAIWGLASGHR